MGRSSREQAERNRLRVLESACRLFRQHGVENVSIADVMAAAELTPGGFYKQFESREALVDEAFALAFDQSNESWQKVRKTTPDRADSALTTLVKHYFKQRAPEKACPLLCLASQAANRTSTGRSHELYGNGAHELFQQFRDEMVNSPSSRDTEKPSEADAMLLFAAMVGTGLLSRAIGNNDWTRAMQSAVLGAVPKNINRNESST